MKTKLIRFVLLAAFAALLTPAAQANPITDSASYSLNTTIPDNNLIGVADTHAFATTILSITSVQVTLDISGGFNGDYYAYLSHGNTGFAVLLNRAGVTAANASGYADGGLNVTFSDTAANGDIHNYQTVVNPGGGSLTGTWQPDGRNVNPQAVLNTTPRTAALNSFDGLDGGGDWTLFVADASPLGIGTLEGWSLQVTGTTGLNTVPETATIFLEIFPIAFGFFSGQIDGKETVSAVTPLMGCEI